MKPLNCCIECERFDKEKNEMKNKIYCMFSCNTYFEEETLNLYNEFKSLKGCSTCKNCKHTKDYPAYVTAEECECTAGLECDTVNFTVKDCESWVGKFEE